MSCLSSCGRAKEREKAQIISELRQKYPLKELLKLRALPRFYNRTITDLIFGRYNEAITEKVIKN